MHDRKNVLLGFLLCFVWLVMHLQKKKIQSKIWKYGHRQIGGSANVIAYLHYWSWKLFFSACLLVVFVSVSPLMSFVWKKRSVWTILDFTVKQVSVLTGFQPLHVWAIRSQADCSGYPGCWGSVHGPSDSHRRWKGLWRWKSRTQRNGFVLSFSCVQHHLRQSWTGPVWYVIIWDRHSAWFCQQTGQFLYREKCCFGKWQFDFVKG